MTHRRRRSAFSRPSETCDIPSQAFYAPYDGRFAHSGGGRCAGPGHALSSLCDSRFGNFSANETQGGKIGAQTVAAVATKILPPANRQARQRCNSQNVAL